MLATQRSKRAPTLSARSENSSMRTSFLGRILSRTLLFGAPFATLGCSSSSCPDNGVEPPPASKKTVDPSLAGGGELDATQCASVCDATETGVITCVRTAP